MKSSKDRLITFMFEKKNTRANAVQISESWRKVVSNHSNLPEVAKKILGELTVASILLSSSIKNKGSVSLQLLGHGPIKLAFAECESDYTFRSTIKISDRVNDFDSLSFKEIFQINDRSTFSVSINSKDTNKPPYQGIIPVEGKNLSQVLKNYLKNSEQICSDIILCADLKTAKGMLIQKMPNSKEDDKTEWVKLLKIFSNLNPYELVQDDMKKLSECVFEELKPKKLKDHPLTFGCKCSKYKVESIIKQMGKEESEKLLMSKGIICITCNFCNSVYNYSKKSCEKLFSKNSLSH